MAQESSKSLLEKLDELPAKAADKLTELALRAYSAVSNKESLPANQKVFLDTFIDKNKGQITEKYFNEAELRAIGKMIASKGGEKGSIRYEDYMPFMQGNQTSAKAGVLKAGENPYESVRTTLGQFNYRKDPATQQYVVEDRYDFNRRNPISDRLRANWPASALGQPKQDPEKVLMMSDYVAQPEVINPANMNPYQALRLYAGRNMPEGQGRPVRVNVPRFEKGGEAKRFSQEDLDKLVRQAAAYAGEEALVTLPYTDAQGNQLRVPASRARELLDNLNTFFFNQEITDQTTQGPRGAQTIESGVAPVVFADVTGGKATYDIPVGEGELRLGASGAYVKPVGQPGKASVGEYEASYSSGGKRLGGAYNPNAEVARFFYEQQLGNEGMAGVGYVPQQGQMNSDQVQFFLNKRFAEGGEANIDDLVAPPVVVTPEEDQRIMNLQRKGYRESAREAPAKTDSRGMLERLMAGRKEMTGTLPGIGADIAAGTLNPIYGVASSAADFEIARKEGDLLGMGLSGVGMIPVVGPLLKGAGAAAPFLLGAVKPKGGNWLRLSPDSVGEMGEIALRTPEAQTEQYRELIPHPQGGVRAGTVGVQGEGRVLTEPEEVIKDLTEALKSEEVQARGPEYVAQLQQSKKTAVNAKAMNDWISKNFTNYIKKQMGSPEDPLRQLAEEGIQPLRPALAQSIARELPLIENIPASSVRRAEESLFDTREVLAQSEQAKIYEGLTDTAIGAMSAGDILSRARGGSRFMQSVLEQNPWLKEVSPDTKAYTMLPPAFSEQDARFLGQVPDIPRDLNIEHVKDVLRTQMQEGQLDPKRLSQMSVADAYRRVAEFDAEMAREAKKAQMARTQALLDASPEVEYADGFRWVALPNANTDKEKLDLVMDIGCTGGWCTQREGNARYYTNIGENRRAYVLLDPEGYPHIQANVDIKPFGPDEEMEVFRNWMASKGEDERAQIGATLDNLAETLAPIGEAEDIPIPVSVRDMVLYHPERISPELAAQIDQAKEAAFSSPVQQITQIKPWSNDWASQKVLDKLATDPTYREKITPYIQDFVLSRQNVQTAYDLENARLYGFENNTFDNVADRRLGFVTEEALIKAALELPTGFGAAGSSITNKNIRDLRQLYQEGRTAEQLLERMKVENPELYAREAETFRGVQREFFNKVNELSLDNLPARNPGGAQFPRKMADGGEVMSDTWCPSFLYRNR